MVITEITYTHKGILYRDRGSSIHTQFWYGYDNVRKPPKNTILYGAWVEGRTAARNGLYTGAVYYLRGKAIIN